MIKKLNRNLIDLQSTSVYDFNELTLQDLLCKFFDKINNCVDVSNQALSFLEWLKEEGLPIEVQKEIEKMYLDGRLTELINQLANDITGKLNTLNQDYQEFKNTTKNSINENKIKIQDNTNNKVNYVNVVTMFGAKGDGLTDDTQKIQSAINYCIEKNYTLYFPSGYIFAITQPLQIVKRINIEGGGAEIKAISEIETIITINESIYYDGNGTNLENRLDLFEIVNVTLPTLNANRKANKCLNHWQGVKVNYNKLNLINCGGTSFYFRNATESIVNDLHIHGFAKMGSVGIDLHTGDTTINNVNIIDCHTAIKDRGINIFNNVHAWIKTKEILLNSTFLEFYGLDIITLRLNQCYADTYQYVFKSSSLKHNVQANQLFVIYNTDIYTSEFPQPVLFYCSYTPNDYAFNWSNINNSYIQGATNNNKIIFANFNNCNVKFDTNNFFVCVDGIRKLSNSSIKLNNGVTVNKRNIVRRDGGVISINFSLKVDLTVTGTSEGIVNLGNISESVLLPYNYMPFVVFCHETDNSAIPNNPIFANAILEPFSTDDFWRGLLRIKIPNDLLTKNSFYVNGSLTYINNQLTNSSLNYATDVT